MFISSRHLPASLREGLPDPSLPRFNSTLRDSRPTGCFGSFQVACEIAPAFREPLTRRRLRFRSIPEISGEQYFRKLLNVSIRYSDTFPNSTFIRTILITFFYLPVLFKNRLYSLIPPKPSLMVVIAQLQRLKNCRKRSPA